MNSFKVGLELKKLVYKRNIGQGEWLYVSAASNKEVSGKKEIVDLLKEELSWDTLYALKLPGESEESFCKTVRKQVSHVLFEDHFVKLAQVQSPVEVENDVKVKKAKLDPPRDTNNITITSEVEDNEVEVKPLDVRVFRLAPVPVGEGVVDAEDEETEASPVETVNIQKLEEETEISRKVLIFNIDKSLSQKRLKEELFDKIDNLVSVKKTVTADEKYRGVCLASFNSEEAAKTFVNESIELETKYLVRLDKILLRDYRVDKFFQRQILKSRSFKKTQGPIIEALADLKKTEKLAQCVIIDLKNDVEEDLINEYFSGLDSAFVDKYELEDLPRKLDSPRTSKYALIFQSFEEAKDFVTKTELHNIEDQTFKVTLLSDLMRKIRYGEKVKNFSDSQSSEAEDKRKIVIGTFKKESSPEDVQAFLEKTFPNAESIQRARNLDFFLGIYVLTFLKETEAKSALETELGPCDALKTPITMSLVEYMERRAKFLKDLFPRNKRKRTDSQESSDDSWVREFENIKELHLKLWGKEAEDDVSMEEEEKTSGNLSQRLFAMAQK